MARFLWACWDGGGNLTPSLGIARALEREGHRVRFHGRPDMVDRVEAAGFDATPLAESYTALDRYAFHPMPTVFGYTSSPLVGEELVDVVGREAPDVVVVDAMFSAALQVAPQFRRPTGVMLHTFLHRILDGWRANFEMQSESRQRAGFGALDPLDDLWGARDLVHVNTLGEFDGTPNADWACVVHGAPVLATERRAVATTPRGRSTTRHRSCCSASARCPSNAASTRSSGRSTPSPRCPCTSWEPPGASSTLPT